VEKPFLISNIEAEIDLNCNKKEIMDDYKNLKISKLKQKVI